jgi:hypothetical protein
MFYLSSSNSTPDTMPRYYTDASHTTTAPVSDLTPPKRIEYVYNRTGIDGYSSLNSYWK